MTVQTVYFVNGGQDFLEFDICNGRIVASRPTEDRGWRHLQVVTPEHEITPGILLRVRNTTIQDAATMTIRLPVLKVEHHPHPLL